jgi:hypothetical protein
MANEESNENKMSGDSRFWLYLWLIVISGAVLITATVSVTMLRKHAMYI